MFSCNCTNLVCNWSCTSINCATETAPVWCECGYEWLIRQMDDLTTTKRCVELPVISNLCFAASALRGSAECLWVTSCGWSQWMCGWNGWFHTNLKTSHPVAHKLWAFVKVGPACEETWVRDAEDRAWRECRVPVEGISVNWHHGKSELPEVGKRESCVNSVFTVPGLWKRKLNGNSVCHWSIPLCVTVAWPFRLQRCRGRCVV